MRGKVSNHLGIDRARGGFCMSETPTPTLESLVKLRRDSGLPIHVAVEYGRNTYSSTADPIAQKVAKIVAADEGEVIDDADELTPGDVIVLALNDHAHRTGRDWQQLRAYASTTRADSYAGLVAAVPSCDVSDEVYHAADVLVRVRGGELQGVFRPRCDHPGGEWYLDRLESEVIDS